MPVSCNYPMNGGITTPCPSLRSARNIRSSSRKLTERSEAFVGISVAGWLFLRAFGSWLFLGPRCGRSGRRSLDHGLGIHLQDICVAGGCGGSGSLSTWDLTVFSRMDRAIFGRRGLFTEDLVASAGALGRGQ